MRRATMVPPDVESRHTEFLWKVDFPQLVVASGMHWQSKFIERFSFDTDLNRVFELDNALSFSMRRSRDMLG